MTKWISPNRYINSWGGVTCIGLQEVQAYGKELKEVQSVVVKQPEEKVCRTFESRDQSQGEWLTF